MELKLDSKDLEKFHKYLKTHPDLVKKYSGIAMEKSGFVLEEQAKREAPVDTSRLRTSIRAKVTPLKTTVTPMVEYAVYVHEGTRNQKKNPFLTRASEKKRKTVIGFFKKALDQIVTALKNG